MHRVLFDFYGQNQLSTGVERLHFNSTIQVKQGSKHQNKKQYGGSYIRHRDARTRSRRKNRVLDNSPRTPNTNRRNNTLISGAMSCYPAHPNEDSPESICGLPDVRTCFVDVSPLAFCIKPTYVMNRIGVIAADLDEREPF